MLFLLRSRWISAPLPRAMPYKASLIFCGLKLRGLPFSSLDHWCQYGSFPQIVHGSRMNFMSEVLPKRQRASKACDFCNSRGLKCKQSERGCDSCLTCLEYGRLCTRTRKSKKRGKKPKSSPADTSIAVDCLSAVISGDGGSSSSSEGAQRLDRHLLERLLDLYLDTVHPVYENGGCEMWLSGPS